MGELKTVAFYGTCVARSELTLVSPRISTPFELRSIRAFFPVGTLNLLRLSFLVAMDSVVSTSGLPPGVSLLADYGQVDYVVGNGAEVFLRHEVLQEYGGSFVKVHGVNDDFFDHAMDVQLTIALLERR